MNNKLKNQQGYIALVAILIIVAVTLSIGLSMNWLSIGETKSGLLKQQSTQSFSIADSCIQEAMLRIERDNNYAGGSLNTGQGSCNITVVPSGADRLITAESNLNSIVRKIESSVTIVGNNIQFNYWKELNI